MSLVRAIKNYSIYQNITFCDIQVINMCNSNKYMPRNSVEKMFD